MDITKVFDNIDESFHEEVESLRRQVAIRSVVADLVTKDGEVLPFGEGVNDSLEDFLALGESMGFRTANLDGYAGYIEFGEGEEEVCAVGHLDVVPEGENWSENPFGGEMKDSYIYGRGTTDDKGPMIACLYGLKALKDAGWQPNKRVRIICGLDEETGLKSIEHYLLKEKEPTMGFTPDGDFPVIYCEMGIMVFQIAVKLKVSSFKGLELRSLEGGMAPNMVPDRARAVVRYTSSKGYDEIKNLAKEFTKNTGYKISTKGVGKSLEILSQGRASHGAYPGKGLNAISVLFAFLGRLEFASDSLADFIGFYNERIGFDLEGKGLNIFAEDDETGKTIVNVGMADLTKDALTLTLNVRYPLNITYDEIYDRLQRILDEKGLGVVKMMHEGPLYCNPDDVLVKRLMEVYRDHTGEKESEPIVISGGTYARAFSNIVAFGALMQGEEDRMHQKDERISLDKLKFLTRIYADAMYRLGNN